MRNYFKPKMVDDLKVRTFRGINEIMQKVKA
jgi:hypothetical protein